jgi:2-C-methyl-D-erythritol 2,4-cyclodiphosphate synthase
MSGLKEVAVDMNLQSREKHSAFRVGHGFDVHRFAEDRKLILGGCEVPYEKGLLGHSDADVVIHALMDAMLGAAALGDIGKHFPDTDPKYEGISSIKLLEKVTSLIDDAGWYVVNADITVICQAPKLAPYISSMREKTARAMDVEVSAVNVKATTTEKLGFTGRGEGIAAEAVCFLAAKPV